MQIHPVNLERVYRIRAGELEAELKKFSPGYTVFHSKNKLEPHLAISMPSQDGLNRVCHISLEHNPNSKTPDILETKYDMSLLQQNPSINIEQIKEHVLQALCRAHLPLDVAIGPRLETTEQTMVSPAIVRHAKLQRALREEFEDLGVAVIRTEKGLEVHGRLAQDAIQHAKGSLAHSDDSLLARIDVKTRQPENLAPGETRTGGIVEAFRAYHNALPVGETIARTIRKCINR